MLRLSAGSWKTWGAATVVAVLATVYLVTRGMLVYGIAGLLVAAAVVIMISDLRIALIVAVFSIPVEDFIVLGSGGTVTRLVIMVLTGSYLFHVLRRRLRVRWRGLAAVGWLWLLWCCASLAWSYVPRIGHIGSLVQLVLMAFIVSGLIAERPSLLRMALWSYTASACTIASLGVIRFFTRLNNVGPVRTSAGSAENVAHFAAYLLPALVFLLVMALHARLPWTRRLPMVLLAVLVALGILVSGTRSAWVGGSVALLLVVMPPLRTRRKFWLIGTAVLVVVAALQLPGVGSFVTRRSDVAISSGGSGRVDIWKVGAGIVPEVPLKGVGFSNYALNFGFQEVRKAPFELQHVHLVIGSAPHSIYLGNLVELGGIGLVLFLLWMFPLLLELRGRGVYLLAVRGAFLAYLVQGAYLDILNRKYFWLFLGLAEGCRQLLARAGEGEHQGELEGVVADEPLPKRS